MSNQVQIRIDQRAFYGLIAVVAVLCVFGLGWFLASAMTPKVATNPAPVAQAPAAGAPASSAGAQSNSAVSVVTPNAKSSGAAGAPGAPAAGKGSPPVSVADVPVGEGQSRIAVEGLDKTNYQFDMGQIAADKPAEHEFIVQNVGKALLVIEQATASCGCTAAVVADKEIAPGKSTTLRVSYDPRVNQEYGKFVQKQIRIKSNDPVVPLAEFTVTADVAAQ